MSHRAIRVVMICLSLFLVCGMAATAADKVALRVASWTVGEEDTFKNLADAFNKLNPNITFTFEAKPFDQFFVLIDTQLQAGEAPDLFSGLGTASTVLAKWARAGSILPLDGIIDASKFFPWLVKDFSVDGKIFQTPSLVGDLYGVLYNKDLFDQYGQKPPKTQADFIKLCDFFLSKGITPLYLPGKNLNQDALINIVCAYAPAWNNNFPWHKRHYADPEFVKVMRLVQSWVDKGYFGKDFKSLDSTTVLTLYSQGKIAMSLSASYNVMAMVGAVPNTSLFFLPTADGKFVNIQTPSQANGYCLNSATKHKAEAITLLKWLNTPSANQEIVDKYGAVPLAQPASKGITVNDPITKIFATSGTPVPCWLDQISPIAAAGYDAWSIVSTEFAKLYYKQATPEQIAADFDQMTDWTLVK
jgi:raffinose/stachyose/melibiose transport system substrate-binding protein